MISILIIGNEILSYQVEDINLKHMLIELNRAGHTIDEARIVRDDIDVIADAIRELSARSTYLISTGGVGPTHDDVTLKAYAQAFDAPLTMNPELEERIRSFFGENTTASGLRMALTPEGVTELVYEGGLRWPIVKVANCFVLPGLPEVFFEKFKGVMAYLPQSASRFYADLFTSSYEVHFADDLTEVQAQFSSVEIGSYPQWENAEFKTHITFKGHEADQLEDAFDQMRKLLEDKQTLVRFNTPKRVTND